MWSIYKGNRDRGKEISTRTNWWFINTNDVDKSYIYIYVDDFSMNWILVRYVTLNVNSTIVSQCQLANCDRLFVAYAASYLHWLICLCDLEYTYIYLIKYITFNLLSKRGEYAWNSIRRRWRFWRTRNFSFLVIAMSHHRWKRIP